MGEVLRESNIRLANPRWLKFGIAGGTIMFLGLAVVSMLTFEESGPIFAITAGAFFSYLTYRGAVLCRFLNAELEVDGATLVLRDGELTQQFPLSGVRFKFEDWLQIISVYDSFGELIFAIDYVGQNVTGLKQIAA